AALVSGMEGRPVTLRTFDIGGDKLPEALAGYAASDIANPALGLRAIRLSLRDRRLLDVQLAAMLRAAARGPVRIMLPMVSTVSEVRRAREAMEQVSRRLRRRGVRIPDELPPLGAMVEVPAAALAADALAAEADFFAIGTNDLVQYTLAVDRSDETVADLYNPLHPAVLRLIQFAVEAAARRDIPISICGEIAGDPRYAALLLGLGLRQLSMSPRNIPRVKQRIRNLDMVAHFAMPDFGWHSSISSRGLRSHPANTGGWSFDRASSCSWGTQPRCADTVRGAPPVDDIKISLYLKSLPIPPRRPEPPDA